MVYLMEPYMLRRGRPLCIPVSTCFRVVAEAFLRFSRDDGWAIASHISLSILMAMFPFLIVVTALAGIAGSVNLANEVARLMFAVWPKEVAGTARRRNSQRPHDHA